MQQVGWVVLWGGCEFTSQSFKWIAGRVLYSNAYVYVCVYIHCINLYIYMNIYRCAYMYMLFFAHTHSLMLNKSSWGMSYDLLETYGALSDSTATWLFVFYFMVLGHFWDSIVEHSVCRHQPIAGVRAVKTYSCTTLLWFMKLMPHQI